MNRRARPLTNAVIRGLHVMVSLAEKDLEGCENEWVGPKGVFNDTSIRDLNAASVWLTDQRSRRGMLPPVNRP